MPHEGKQREQMALTEKQMMKEDEGDRGGKTTPLHAAVWPRRETLRPLPQRWTHF